MKRIALTDDTGRWFDAEKSEEYKNETYWDGSNHISKATNSQFYKEYLYKTATGKWIKHAYSAYQGTPETYEAITEKEAAVWFLKQGMDLPEPLQNYESQYEL